MTVDDPEQTVGLLTTTFVPVLTVIVEVSVLHPFELHACNEIVYVPGEL